jgi:hypothetical protein
MFGKRPVGELRKRWQDAVKEDSYQMLKWRHWEVKAQDREGGGRESRMPTPALGCSATDDYDDVYFTVPSICSGPHSNKK